MILIQVWWWRGLIIRELLLPAMTALDFFCYSDFMLLSLINDWLVVLGQVSFPLLSAMRFFVNTSLFLLNCKLIRSVYTSRHSNRTKEYAEFPILRLPCICLHGL